MHTQKKKRQKSICLTCDASIAVHHGINCFVLATKLPTVGVEPFVRHSTQPEIGQLPGALPELL